MWRELSREGEQGLQDRHERFWNLLELVKSYSWRWYCGSDRRTTRKQAVWVLREMDRRRWQAFSGPVFCAEAREGSAGSGKGWPSWVGLRSLRGIKQAQLAVISFRKGPSVELRAVHTRSGGSSRAGQRWWGWMGLCPAIGSSLDREQGWPGSKQVERKQELLWGSLGIWKGLSRTRWSLRDTWHLCIWI